MKYSAWIRQLDKGLVKGAYICLITEPYLWEAMKRVILSDIVGEGLRDFNYDHMNFRETSCQELENALETMPMMADQRVIVLEDVPLDRDQVKKYEEELRVLSDYLAEPNPSTVLFMGFRGEKPYAGKLFKEMQVYLERVELSRLGPGELESFIVKNLQKSKLVVEKGVVEEIIRASAYLDQKSEASLYDVANMLDQVKGTEIRGRVSLDGARGVMVEDVEDNIFRLMDAISNRDAASSLKLYRGFISLGKNEHQLFTMIIRQFRNLIGVKAMAEKRIPDRDGMKRLNLKPYEYQKLRGHIGRFSMDELLADYQKIFDIHKRSRLGNTDFNLIVETFLVEASLRK